MNEELFDQALEAYKKVCDKHITVYNRQRTAFHLLCYQAPSWYASEVGRKYVYLRNCNGDIARYNIKTKTISV